MGRQINFYLHPDDYKEFEDLIKAKGDIIYVGKHAKDWLDKTIQEKQIDDSTLVTTW